MTVLRKDEASITVPPDVVDDYRAEGWLPAGETPARIPDDSWTVEQLRSAARDRGVDYKGLRKEELLEALL